MEYCVCCSTFGFRVRLWCWLNSANVCKMNCRKGQIQMHDAIAAYKRMVFFVFAFVFFLPAQQRSTWDRGAHCTLSANEQVYRQACNVTSIACWLPFKRISVSVFVSNLCRFVYFLIEMYLLVCYILITFADGCALSPAKLAAYRMHASYKVAGLSLIWFSFSHTCGRIAKETATATTTTKTKRKKKKKKTKKKNIQPKNDKRTNSSQRSLQAKSHDFYT